MKTLATPSVGVKFLVSGLPWSVSTESLHVVADVLPVGLEIQRHTVFFRIQIFLNAIGYRT